MIITYFGKQFYKIEQGKLVIAFNPVSKDSKLHINARFGADIAFITTNHPDYNGMQLSYRERKPFIITGPGDYEVKEIFIKGSISHSTIASKKYINTIYSFELDGIQIVFLGTLSSEELTKENKEIINNADVLFIPLGGDDSMNPKLSAKLATFIEPKIIIPMDYEKDSLKDFLKEMGKEEFENLDKLTLKRRDLEGKDKEITILKAN